MGKRNDNISEKVRASTKKSSILAKKENSQLLGKSIDSAWYMLKKMILFQLIKKEGLDICYHCHNKIDNIDDLSIEHKIPWKNSKDPKRFFYDLNNIAFSHTSCNYRNDGKQRFRVFTSATGMRGVTIINNKCRAQIKKDRKTYYLGQFATKEEAAKAYDMKAIEFWAEKAITNKSLKRINY